MMMQRPSCDLICGRRTTSKSSSNSGARRRSNLAGADATRLLVTFSRMLPVNGNPVSGEQADAARTGGERDQFLHARLQGTKLGVFDVYFDSAAAEQVEAGQAKTARRAINITTCGHRSRCSMPRSAKGNHDPIPAAESGKARTRSAAPLHDHGRGAASETNSGAGAGAV